MNDHYSSSWIKILISNPLSIIGFFLIVGAVMYHYLPSDSVKEIITGEAIIIAAIVTSWYSFKQYIEKQSSLRFQKFYFEDTLYRLAVSVDNTTQICKNNMLQIENLINMAYNILDLEMDSENKKRLLIRIFEETYNKIYPVEDVSTFSLYTLQLLLVKQNKNFVSTWIKDFENDSKRFSSYLCGQTSKIQNRIFTRFDETQEGNFRQYLIGEGGFSDQIKKSYILIERHQILFNWLSIIVFEFSAADFRGMDKIIEFWSSSPIADILKHVNEAYCCLLDPDDNFDFSEITDDRKNQLQLSVNIQLRNIGDFLRKRY